MRFITCRTSDVLQFYYFLLTVTKVTNGIDKQFSGLLIFFALNILCSSINSHFFFVFLRKFCVKVPENKG